MRDNKGHARKLEPTDRQILDEQAALDRPESGTFPMDDEDETALSRTIELKPGDLNDTRSLEELAELASGPYKIEAATSAIKVREARAELEEIIEGEDATVEHHYQPPRVSWTQRVLSWFRRG